MKKIVIPFAITVLLIIIIFLCVGNIEKNFPDYLNQFAHKPYTFCLISFVALTSDIVLPVPSSIIMFINGYVLGVWQGAFLSLLSELAGAAIGFYLGKFTSIGLKQKEDTKAAALLERYGTIAILITRGIPILSESVCIVCGYNKMEFKKYMLFNVIGFSPICLLYAFCGRMGYNDNVFMMAFASSLLVAAAFWFFGKSLFSKKVNQ